MRALWLTEVDVARRAIAMRAVKIALVAAGVEASKAMQEAEKACRLVAAGRGPVGLVLDNPEADVAPGSAETAHAALVAALKDYEGAAVVRLDDFEPQARAPEAPQQITGEAEHERGSVEWIEAQFAAPVPEGFAPSAEVRKTALMVMQLVNGNPQVAWFQVKQFCRNTRQYEFWIDVNHVLTETFVWPGSSS